MMTPDQIKELATLTANVRHIMDALDEVRVTIKSLPEMLSEFAKARELDDLRREVTDLRRDLETLQRSSPARIWELTVKGASGVGIVWGIVALARDFFHIGPKQ